MYSCLIHLVSRFVLCCRVQNIVGSGAVLPTPTCEKVAQKTHALGTEWTKTGHKSTKKDSNCNSEYFEIQSNLDNWDLSNW